MATNPHISLDSAFEYLTSTMRDPMKDTVCAIRLGVAADRINQALEACTSNIAKSKIANSYPEFLRAGIKFLTFNQSPQEHITMTVHLLKCRCDLGQTGIRRFHELSRVRNDGQVHIQTSTFIFDAVATVSNCLILAIADLTQHKFRTGNIITGERRWPQGPEDLLPHGPKDSLVGLELWVAGAPDGYIIFKLAVHLALFHVPFAQEVFRSPNFRFPLGRPVLHLHQEAVKFYDEGDSSPLARTHFFTYPVMEIFSFFKDLSKCDTAQFNLMILARGAWISPILARLSTILSILPPQWSSTRSFITYLTAYATAEIDPKTGISIIKFERDKVLAELQYFDDLEEAFNTMVGARKMGCWNITCSLESEIIHSRLCSKCNLIRFCGEKCQKEAWKSATLPHKSVCAKIHALKESIGADDWPRLWTPDFTYAQFQVICRTKTVDTKVVEAVGRTISGLSRYKGAFREDSERAGASQVDRLVMAERQKLALQKLKDHRDSLGLPSIPIIGRQDTLSMMSIDAYH